MDSLYGSFRTNKFSDIFDTDEKFITEFNNNPVFGSLSYNKDFITKTQKESGDRFNPTLIYYLLMGNYANSYIASSDVNRFKIKMWSLIYQYGPTWAKQLEIQEKLRGLSEDDITTGAGAVFNTAVNPSNDPTESGGILSYINQQNTNKYSKSKLEGYQILWDAIVSDPTQVFMNRFKDLFLTVLIPDYPLLYSEVEDE